MKLILFLLSMTCGTCAVIKTVELMDDATSFMEQATELGKVR